MTLFYSSSAEAFYDDEINTSIPSDAKEISLEDHTSIFVGVAEGKQIDFSGDKPTLIAAEPPTDAQYLEGATMARDNLLATASQVMTPLLMALQLGDASDEEVEKAKAWRAYTKALNAVDLTAREPVWPDVPAQ